MLDQSYACTIATISYIKREGWEAAEAVHERGGRFCRLPSVGSCIPHVVAQVAGSIVSDQSRACYGGRRVHLSLHDCLTD